MPEQNTSDADTTGRSRRTVLKTLGAGGLVAGAVPTVGSAATYDINFICSLDVPTLYTKGGDPVDPEYDAQATIRGQRSADYLITPNEANGVNCGWGGCDRFESKFPWSVSFNWEFNTSYPGYGSPDLGEIYFDIDVENRAPGGDTEYAGWSGTIASDGTTISSEGSGAQPLDPEYPITGVGAENYLRPGTIEFELDFSDSDLHYETVSQKMEFATPNKELVNVNNLLDRTDQVYGTGVKAANRLTSINLGALRKAARLMAYSPMAADGIDLDDLPEQAVINGITAFKEPIEDYQSKDHFGVDAVPTMAGPTIVKN